MRKYLFCENAIMPGGPAWFSYSGIPTSGIWLDVRDGGSNGWFLADHNGDYFGTVHESGLADTETRCFGCNPPSPPVYSHIVSGTPNA